MCLEINKYKVSKNNKQKEKKQQQQHIQRLYGHV